MDTVRPFSKLTATISLLRTYGLPSHGLTDQFHNTMRKMPPERKQNMVGYPLYSYTITTPLGTPCLVSCILQALQLGKIAYDLFLSQSPKFCIYKHLES